MSDGVISARYGRILSFDDVERAAAETLQAWFPFYLRELERQQGSAVPDGGYDDVITFAAAADFTRFADELLPAIVVVVPATADRPTRQAEGNHTVRLGLGVGVFAGGVDRSDAAANAKAYGAVVRAILAQKGKLGDLNAQTAWLGEEYASGLQQEDSYTQAQGRIAFEVEVDDVVTTPGGPRTLPDTTDAPPALGVFTTKVLDVELDTDPLPPDDDLRGD